MSFIDFQETEETKKAKSWLVIFLVLGVAISYFVMKSTLAANITINSGMSVEFGQGMSATTACSGASSLTVTPNSSFTNSTGSTGVFYFKSVTVSGIPSSCNGYDFQISAYDSTTGSSALSLFGSTNSVASIYDNAGTFQSGHASVGSSITSGSGTFTVTFSSPVAVANNVSKMTLQSINHIALDCAIDLICNVGDISGSGGTIFYYSAAAFTETGTACASNCHYLEWAPSTWKGSAQDGNTIVNFWQNGSTYVGNYVTPGLMSYVTKDETGYGYSNTNALIVAGDTSGAPTLARTYAGPYGNTTGQWFMPSKNEMLLARNSSAYSSGNFYAHIYQTSSQSLTDALTGQNARCWSVNFDPGGSASAYTQGCWTNNPYHARAIRAF